VSQPLPAVSAAASAVISRQTLIRIAIAAGLILAGIISMSTLQAAWKLTFNKPPKPLPYGRLDVLPRQLAMGRYVQDGTDELIDESEAEVLGTNDYLMRTYHDSQKNINDPTRVLRLNMNYYGTGGATPHVPEICWAAAGMKEAVRLRVVFDIPDVRRKDGSTITLRAQMISFIPPGEKEDPKRLKNVAYIFNVNGDYVATPREVISRFWKATNKYAFNTKIEVTVGHSNEFCSQQEAQAAVADFFRGTIVQIEDVLPMSDSDPASSEAGATAGLGISH